MLTTSGRLQPPSGRWAVAQTSTRPAEDRPKNTQGTPVAVTRAVGRNASATSVETTTGSPGPAAPAGCRHAWTRSPSPSRHSIQVVSRAPSGPTATLGRAADREPATTATPRRWWPSRTGAESRIWWAPAITAAIWPWPSSTHM